MAIAELLRELSDTLNAAVYSGLEASLPDGRIPVLESNATPVFDLRRPVHEKVAYSSQKRTC